MIAADQQRDFWQDLLAADRHINLDMCKIYPSFINFVDLLLNGIPKSPPIRICRVVQNRILGISEENFIVLWKGSAWRWLDLLTLVKEAAVVARRRNDINFLHDPVQLVSALKTTFLFSVLTIADSCVCVYNPAYKFSLLPLMLCICLSSSICSIPLPRVPTAMLVSWFVTLFKETFDEIDLSRSSPEDKLQRLLLFKRLGASYSQAF